MKYFRTKNGHIIDMTEAAPYIKDPKKSKDLRIFLKSYGFGEIVKEADTVEELCDWFASEDAFNSKFFGPTLFDSVSLARLRAKKSKDKIIGYIVVEEKGVKTIEPVAETNEEGEFEPL